MHRLSRRDHALIDEAGFVLGRAFSDDPAFGWVFPDPDVRRGAATFVKDKLLRAYVPLGHAWVARDEAGGHVLGGVTWAPPGKVPGMWAYVRRGLLAIPLRFGLAAFRRLLAADHAMERIQAEEGTTRSHWFLDTLGVDPIAQGRGVGSSSLAHTLRLTVDPSGTPSALVTTKETNVPFYERFGYEVRRNEQVGGTDGFTVWLMSRPSPAREPAGTGGRSR